MPVVPPELAARRRRLLRRFVTDLGLRPGDIAVAIGIDPDYLAKMLAGSRHITDAIAWQLQHRFGVPFHVLEPPPLFSDPGVQQQLERELAASVR